MYDYEVNQTSGYVDKVIGSNDIASKNTRTTDRANSDWQSRYPWSMMGLKGTWTETRLQKFPDFSQIIPICINNVFVAGWIHKRFMGIIQSAKFFTGKNKFELTSGQFKPTSG